jgi:predicted kinase
LAETENASRQCAGVIVDATFQDAKQRRRFVELAARLEVPVVFIECQAAEAEILRRLEKRASAGNEVSDATREIYLRQRGEFMPLVEVPENSHFVVRTDAAPTEVVDQLESVFERAA